MYRSFLYVLDLVRPVKLYIFFPLIDVYCVIAFTMFPKAIGIIYNRLINTYSQELQLDDHLPLPKRRTHLSFLSYYILTRHKEHTKLLTFIKVGKIRIQFFVGVFLLAHILGWLRTLWNNRRRQLWVHFSNLQQKITR